MRTIQLSSGQAKIAKDLQKKTGQATKQHANCQAQLQKAETRLQESNKMLLEFLGNIAGLPPEQYTGVRTEYGIRLSPDGKKIEIREKTW